MDCPHNAFSTASHLNVFIKVKTEKLWGAPFTYHAPEKDDI